MEETHIWEGTQSQWTNFGYYLLCIPLTAVLGLGIILAIARYLDTKNRKYEVTDQRVITHRGVLSKTTDEVELYRVRDVRHERPMLLNMVGLSTIQLITVDKTSRVVSLAGVPDGKELKEKIRAAVENRRDVKKVREYDN